MPEKARIPAPAFLYNVAIEGPDGHHLINWGDEPGWLERLRPEMETATRLGLIPKDKQSNLPSVTVRLGGGRRWILFSREFRSSSQAIRLYAIGWQATVRGRNVKSIIWVYPGGAIECSEEPGYAQHFLGGKS